jgi:hypothetical protein
LRRAGTTRIGFHIIPWPKHNSRCWTVSLIRGCAMWNCMAWVRWEPRSPDFISHGDIATAGRYQYDLGDSMRFIYIYCICAYIDIYILGIIGFNSIQPIYIRLCI